MDSITFTISNMTEQESDVVKTQLEQIEGVRSVQIDLPTHSVTVIWVDPVTVETLWKRLEAVNITPDLPQSF